MKKLDEAEKEANEKPDVKVYDAFDLGIVEDVM
jgi:hypothetical protein